MSSIVINGDISGAITLQAPAIAGTTTINLPASAGTMATTADVAAAGFAAGTRLGFQQTTAPTGWTKDTTAALNDSIMRIVTGTASSGGSTAFTTFNGQTSTAAFTLTTNEIPSHSHVSGTASVNNGVSFGVSTVATAGNINTQSNQSVNNHANTSSVGGGGSHSHGITTAIKYYDFIIASKN